MSIQLHSNDKRIKLKVDTKQQTIEKKNVNRSHTCKLIDTTARRIFVESTHPFIYEFYKELESMRRHHHYYQNKLCVRFSFSLVFVCIRKYADHLRIGHGH